MNINFHTTRQYVSRIDIIFSALVGWHDDGVRIDSRCASIHKECIQNSVSPIITHRVNGKWNHNMTHSSNYRQMTLIATAPRSHGRSPKSTPFPPQNSRQIGALMLHVHTQKCHCGARH
jgi:hypothetical protein